MQPSFTSVHQEIKTTYGGLHFSRNEIHDYSVVVTQSTLSNFIPQDTRSSTCCIHGWSRRHVSRTEWSSTSGLLSFSSSTCSSHGKTTHRHWSKNKVSLLPQRQRLKIMKNLKTSSYIFRPYQFEIKCFTKKYLPTVKLSQYTAVLQDSSKRTQKWMFHVVMLNVSVVPTRVWQTRQSLNFRCCRLCSTVTTIDSDAVNGYSCK